MANAIFTALFSIIKAIANFFLTPINAIVYERFPSIAILISNFNQFVATYITDILGFFGNVIPPITKNIILFYLAYLLIRYAMILVVHGVLKVLDIIHRIKIW